MKKLAGQVARGRGRATAHLKPATDLLEQVLGGEVTQGSLNVILESPIEFSREQGIEISPQRWVWPADLLGLPILVYRWKGCPLTVVEIVSRLHLRDALGYRDGDEVEISVPDDAVCSTSDARTAVARLVWRNASGKNYYTMRWTRLARQGIERACRAVQ